jgi:hypothetical protein
MTVRLKYPAKVGKTLLPKGAEGQVIGVSNSPSIRATFPNLCHKDDGYFYIVRFPDLDDCLFHKDQLEFLNVSPKAQS